MNLLADVHISPITVDGLRAAGFKINRVTDFIAGNSSDSKIIELARQKNAIIVTQDLDFSALLATQGLSKPSVISLRVGNARPEKILEILKKVLPHVASELERGAIISVEESEYRIRKLPI